MEARLRLRGGSTVWSPHRKPDAMSNTWIVANNIHDVFVLPAGGGEPRYRLAEELTEPGDRDLAIDWIMGVSVTVSVLVLRISCHVL